MSMHGFDMVAPFFLFIRSFTYMDYDNLCPPTATKISDTVMLVV